MSGLDFFGSMGNIIFPAAGAAHRAARAQASAMQSQYAMLSSLHQLSSARASWQYQAYQSGLAQGQSCQPGLQAGPGWGEAMADLIRQTPCKPVLEDIEVWYERLRTRVIALLNEGEVMTTSEYGSWMADVARYREVA